MRITAADLAGLKRKQAQPQRAAGELLAVFAAGKLVNTLNKKWGWRGLLGYRRKWKEVVARALLEAGWRQDGTASAPKVVMFLASTAQTMDDDGLSASLKAVRDALVDCGVIHSDAPASAHEFMYTQRIDRARRGVEIRISLRAPAPPNGGSTP